MYGQRSVSVSPDYIARPNTRRVSDVDLMASTVESPKSTSSRVAGRMNKLSQTLSLSSVMKGQVVEIEARAHVDEVSVPVTA